MKENKTFVITYTKLDGESVTRNGKWTDKCKEFISKQGHKCLDNPEDFMYMYSQENKDFFKNIMDRKYINFEQ